jgi:hypothetical protein
MRRGGGEQGERTNLIALLMPARPGEPIADPLIQWMVTTMKFQIPTFDFHGVECKREDAPRLTPSMRIALEDLKLKHIAIIYPGKKRYALADQVTAVPLASVVDGMKGIFP